MPIPKINDNLVERLEAKLKIRHTTARSYASAIRGLFRQLKGDTKFNGTLNFVTSPKLMRIVTDIPNLSKRKNSANAAIAALKILGGNAKVLADYRQLMMAADKDFQQYLRSGKKKHPFKDGEKEWVAVRNLHKKVARVVSAHSLWKQGEHLDYPGYRTLMALVYLRWISMMPVRRLEYADSRFITREAYRALSEADRKKGNWVVTGKEWKWELWNYKTFGTFGHQSLAIPTQMRNTLKRIQPIALSKNAKGFIFLSTKWGRLSRSSFSIFVKQTFRRYHNKSYTQNTIRAIKVSSAWGKSIKTLDVLQLSEDMGHSLTTQLLHYRQNPSDKKTVKKE